MSTATEQRLRIGEVAEQTGVTPRTIRYWEEIGLLEAGAERVQGKHRCYTPAEVDRIREIVRLRDLLGLSLEQLSQLVEAETARAALRKELHVTEDPENRQRILTELLGHIETQLSLVHSRRLEIEQLEEELSTKQALVKTRLAELGA
ncbi:MAG TPA: MerR family transcriptional regulator [Solirubrobacteraceae bacterium]|nr:MerR family transcriptional regulator [Solirubrobacteraceae bacterium]